MNAQVAYAESAVVIPEWTFADRLRKARSVIGTDQRSFAAQLQCTSSAYAQWEAGNSRPRDIVTIARRIEMLTRVPAAWLLDLDGPEAPIPGKRKGPEGGASGPSLPELDSNQQPAGSSLALDSRMIQRRVLAEVQPVRPVDAVVTDLFATAAA